MYRYWTTLLTVLLTVHAQGQGCSDAGVCTAGPIGQPPSIADSTATDGPRHSARLQYSYAVGEQSVVIMQVQPEINLGLTERLGLQCKMPWVSADGNLGSNSGIGDMVATFNYAFVKEQDRHFAGIAGMRLPTGRFEPASVQGATFGPTSRPLPMPYQVGLGTTDLLLGLQYRQKRATLAVAYQHVLKQDNRSIFLHRYWAGVPEALGYFESVLLERANDAVVRLQYAIPFKRFLVQPGLLGIYHLGEDHRFEPEDPLMLVRRSVEGSDGLTLNVTADVRYAWSDAWWLELSFGSPVIVRKVRPDGLTRHYVVALALRHLF